jgi:hypothetical protein
MPYSHFNRKQVQKVLGLQEDSAYLFPEVEAIAPSDWLKETLNRSTLTALVSEKSRSELIVMPILTDIREQNKSHFAIYSGVNLEADKERGLNGECDFIISHSKQTLDVEVPIFCIVEAKDNDIEEGIGQCIAQMMGALIFNEKEENPLPFIYGCVSTGTEWQFLKLEGKTYYIDLKRYYLGNVSEILGVLQHITNTFNEMRGISSQ